MTLADYVELPWTVRRTEYDDDGRYVALTVDELPGLVGAGRTNDEAEAAFRDALEAFLRSYLDAGEEPPLPDPARGGAFAARRD
jgi:predicted RNase H-like HicB family nuclease